MDPQQLTQPPSAPRSLREAETLRHQLWQERDRHKRLTIIRRWQNVVDEERHRYRKWALNGKSVWSHKDEQSSTSAALGRQISKLWQTSRPTPIQMERRAKAVRDIQTFLDAQWPGSGLVAAPFGSSVTGMYNANSDIDICILDPSRPLGVGQPAETVDMAALWGVPMVAGLPEWYDVRTLARHMKRSNNRQWTQIVPIQGANVPIVKFNAGPLSVDITVNNRFGVINSQLINSYADLRPLLFRPLCYAIKHWLNRRGLNDPSGKSGVASLSSYSIVLLVIQYLQSTQDLPNLQSPDLLCLRGAAIEYQWQAPKNIRRRTGQPARRPDPLHGATNVDLSTAPAANATEHQHEATQSTATSETRSRKFVPSKYNVAFFDPKNVQQGVKEVVDNEFRYWSMGNPSPGLSGACGRHRVDPRQNDLEEINVRLEEAFIGFIEWYRNIPKRQVYISIAHGHPCPLRGALSPSNSNDGEHHSDTTDGLARSLDLPDANDTRLPGRRSPTKALDGDVTTPTTSQPDPSLSPDQQDQQQQPPPPHPIDWLSSHLTIQDPLIPDRNTTKNISEIVANRLEIEFERVFIFYPICEDDRYALIQNPHDPPLLSLVAYPFEYEEALRIQNEEDLEMFRLEGWEDDDGIEELQWGRGWEWRRYANGRGIGNGRRGRWR